MKKVLHAQRFDISNDYITNKSIRTGDIFFRQGNEVFWGLPFSKMVATITSSKYSHASVALVEGNEIYLVEVALDGTEKYRLIDWLDFCGEPFFEVWRLKENPGIELTKSIQDFLSEDGDYNLTFEPNSNKYYCTESIVEIFKRAGLPALCEGSLPKDLLPWWKYYLLFLPINFIMKKLFGASMPTTTPLICVGNDKIGIMSSKYIHQVHYYSYEK
jgi:hypothetical protein